MVSKDKDKCKHEWKDVITPTLQLIIDDKHKTQYYLSACYKCDKVKGRRG